MTTSEEEIPEASTGSKSSSLLNSVGGILIGLLLIVAVYFIFANKPERAQTQGNSHDAATKSNTHSSPEAKLLPLLQGSGVGGNTSLGGNSSLGGSHHQ